MKIIIADNLNLDYFNETLVADNVSEGYAEIITELLNRKYNYQATYFKVVPDDHILEAFEKY